MGANSSFAPISLMGTHSHQSVPSYSYYGRLIRYSRRQVPLRPGSRPVFLKTPTCNRPLTRYTPDFRDWLLKAPASASCVGLPEARVEKLRGTPGDSFWLFNLPD